MIPHRDQRIPHVHTGIQSYLLGYPLMRDLRRRHRRRHYLLTKNNLADGMTLDLMPAIIAIMMFNERSPQSSVMTMLGVTLFRPRG
jgi:hypothetical protein